MARLSGPTVRQPHRGPRLIAATSVAVAVAGVGAALALVLGATSTTPAFGVTRNHDGTVTISIKRSSGIAGANARLRQLGIRATVTQRPPAGCQPTVSIPMGGQGAPESAAKAGARWRIDPSKVPAGHQLVLTPPPPPPAGNSGNSGSERPCLQLRLGGPSARRAAPFGQPAQQRQRQQRQNSGNSGNGGNGGDGGSEGQVWSCGSEGPGPGGPPPAGNSGNSGNS